MHFAEKFELGVYTYRSFWLRVPGVSIFTRTATHAFDHWTARPQFLFQLIIPSICLPSWLLHSHLPTPRHFLLKSHHSHPSTPHLCNSDFLKFDRIHNCNTKMVYSLTYRRPASSKGSIASEKPSSYNGSMDSGSTESVSRGIPDALSFNRIIEGGTCPVRLRSAFTFNPQSLTTPIAVHYSRVYELLEVYRA